MINILEILKKIPNLEDMVFYSPLYGDVRVRIKYNHNPYSSEEALIEIYSEIKVSIYLNEYGQYYREGECMLYPSRQQRNWSEFKILRKDLPEGETVLVSRYSGTWVLRKYAGNGNCYSVCDGKTKIDWDYIIPVDKFNFKDWSFKEEDNYGVTHKE